MTYSQYLQEGGTVQSQESNVQQQVVELIQAAMSGNEEAKKQIQQIMQAAQQGDSQAAQIAQMIQAVAEQMQGRAESMKCGGKVKPKKKEIGGFIKKASKGCTCQLKKVGGKLIEVDGCTGLPVKRQGGILKGENAIPGGIRLNPYPKVNPVEIAQKNIQRTYKSMTTPSGVKVFIDNYGNQYWDNGRMRTKEGVMQSYDINSIPKELRQDYWEEPEPVEEQQVTLPSKEVIAAKYYTPYNGLFSSNNLKQYQSFATRKKFIQNNKSWLNQQGFDTTNYKGSAAQNQQLLKLIQKKQEIDAKNAASHKARYQDMQEQLNEATPEPYAAPNATITSY